MLFSKIENEGQFGGAVFEACPRCLEGAARPYRGVVCPIGSTANETKQYRCRSNFLSA